ncbi:MAG: hypothetical protein IK083_09715 [Abditibacteriota bacterium]|nr:hypothetical protein [Abditibacteriota bacterium]
MIVLLSLCMLVVAAFFARELVMWKKDPSLAGTLRKFIRTSLFAATELCFGLFAVFPYLRTVLGVRAMLGYLAAVLALMLVMTAFLVWDLLLTRAEFRRR